jgi:signal recognition particle subunit SRP54
MTGQDAVSSAAAFNEALELDGVILTKLDGDARGGAALSVRKVTGVPIKFVGKGEKLDRLETFDPERLVGQILGMGDIVGLVEAAQATIDAEEAQRQQEKLAKGKFDLDDFRKQILQMKKMGSMRELLGKIPGLNQIPMDALGGMDPEEDIKRIEGMIDSMTPEERCDPALIDISRRRRIAAGSGVDPSEVSGLVKQFDGMAALVKQMAQMSMMDRVRALTGLGRAAAVNPMGRFMTPKVGTGKRLSPKEREKLRKQREKEERRRRREERNRP